MKSLIKLPLLSIATLLGVVACTPPGVKPMKSARNMTGSSTLGSSSTITANFSAAQVLVNENDGPVTLTINLNLAAPTDLQIPFSVVGSAANPQDHDLPSSGTINIVKGAKSGTLAFQILNDQLFESAESLTVKLVGPMAGSASSVVVNIADNDPAPVVQFSAAAQALTEGPALPGVATVQLSALSGLPVTVNFQVSGTASNPADHNLANGTVTIPAGQMSAPINFALADDTVYEGNETLILTLGAPTNASLGATTSHTVTVSDNESIPTLQWELAAQDVLETAATAMIRYRLSGASALPVTAQYTVSGTASVPGDHSLASGSFVIPALSVNGALQFNIVNDAISEGDETLVAQLNTATNAVVGALALHTSTVKDDDAPPTIEWSAAFSTINEAAGTAMVSAKLSRTSALPVSVPFIVSGTAANPADHNLANGTVTIPAGQTTAAVTFSIVNDLIYEGNETIILSMGQPTNGILGAAAVHTVTLADDETAPLVQFSAASQAVSEGAGTVTVQVTLSQVSTMNTSVAVAVAGTATNPADHSLSPSTVSIPAGQTSAAINFSVVDDAIFEGNETVILTLSNPVNSALGTNAVHTVTIQDNETAPTVQFASAAQTLQESLGAGSLSLTLNKASAKPVTVSYAVAGTATNPGDHNLAAGSVTIPAGQTSASVNFSVVKDGVAEADETIIVTLVNPIDATLGTPAVHTVTISDVVANPSVDFAIMSQTVQENVGTVNLALRLNAPGAANISVPFTVSGSAANPADHNLANGSVTIPAGSVSASISINVINDTLDENDETLVVTLGAPTGAGSMLGANTAHTLTIADDDAAPIVQFATAAQSAQESAGLLNIQVSLSAASGKAISVPFTVAGTSTNPADHNLSAGTVNIPAGSTSAVIPITVVNDTLFEGNETVLLTLGAPVNATLGAAATHTLTIVDDEAAPSLSFAAAAQNVSEAVGTVNVQLNLSAAMAAAVTVPFTVSGTSANPADHNLANGSLTIPAGSTTATATFTIVNDTVYEGNETVILTLGNPSPATVLLGANKVHTMTITDNETQPVVQFATAVQSVNENIGTVTVTLSLSGASVQPVTVPYSLGGTASSADHNLAAGQITIPAGSVSQTLNFNIVNDTAFEPNETIAISLGTPSGATLGATGLHTVTIVNDDLQPTIQWSVASQTVNEDAGTLTLTASLSAASGVVSEATVSASGTATSGVDFAPPAAKVSIPAGATSASFALQITNDTLNETNETVVLTLSAPLNATLGANAAHTVTINDNDAMPTLQFNVASQSVDENSGTAVAIVSLSSASGKAITVSYTPGGNANNLTANRTKYNLAAGTLTIPAGATQTALNVPLVNDALPGPSDFYIFLSLSAPTNATLGATPSQTITIVDNDPASPIGVEGYRVSVWPLARARCIGCHGASAALPNFASDDLTTAYTAAKPKADFTNISNSKLVLKASDGHCGANCTIVNGAATETRPMMIAAITQWASYESMTSPAPTPTPTPSPAPTGGSLALRDAPNYIQYVTSSVGLDPNNYQYATPYTDLITRLSPDGDVGAISAPMLLAYTTMASKVCEDLVNKEKALAINNAGRVAFGPIDFATNTNIATAVLTQANVDAVTMNLARLYWRRDALAAEQTELFNMVASSIQGRTLTNTDTARVMVLTCTSVASAMESLQY